MTSLAFDANSQAVRSAHDRLSAAYAREQGASFPIVDPGDNGPQIPFPERLESLDKMLEYAVGKANAIASIEGNDWPPFITNYCTVPLVPEAFGCPLVVREDDIATRPCSCDIADVWGLNPRPLDEVSTIRRMFEWVDFSQRKLGTDLPFWTADIQAPFTVACQIVSHEELLAACVTDPEAVHCLCRMITDYSIELMGRHIAQLDHPGFPGANFPSISENIGICIADDTPLIMLSPEMYREFALPYNAELGEAFGGIHVHSCGDYSHNLDTLLDLPGIRSFQAHVGPGEFPLPTGPAENDAFNRARGRIACFIDANDVTRGDEFRDDPRRHYREYVIPRLCAGDLTGVILQNCQTTPDDPDPSEALAWTRRQIEELAGVH